MKIPALTAGVVMGVAAMAQGSISYLQQTREHTLNGGTISDAAGSFAPFASTITDPGPGRFGESVHSSNLSATGIDAAGSVLYTGSGAPGGFTNLLDVVFTVSAGADWTLSGLIDSAGEVNGEENFVEIIFRNESVGPSGTVLFGFDTFGGSESINRVVSLVPGNEYRLLISLGGEYFGPNEVASSYDLSFVPSPGPVALLSIGAVMALRRRR